MFPRSKLDWIMVGRIPEQDVKSLGITIDSDIAMSEIPGLMRHNQLENPYFRYGQLFKDQFSSVHDGSDSIPISWEELFRFVTNYAWIESKFRFILDKPCWTLHSDVVDRVVALYFARRQYENVRSGTVVYPGSKEPTLPNVPDGRSLIDARFGDEDLGQHNNKGGKSDEKNPPYVDYLYTHNSFYSTLKLLTDEISELLGRCSLVAVPAENPDGDLFYNLYVNHIPDSRCEHWTASLLHRVTEWGDDHKDFMPRPQLDAGLNAKKFESTMKSSNDDLISSDMESQKTFIHLWESKHPGMALKVANSKAVYPSDVGDFPDEVTDEAIAGESLPDA